MRRSRRLRTPAQFLILAGITLASAAGLYAAVHHALDQVMSGAHRQAQQLKTEAAYVSARPETHAAQRSRGPTAPEIAEAKRTAELRQQERQGQK